MSDNVFDVADYGKKINTSVNVFKRLFIVYGIAAFLCTVAGVYLVANPSVAMDAQDSEYAYVFNGFSIFFFVLFLTSPIVLLIHSVMSRNKLICGIKNHISLAKDDGIKVANQACLSYTALSIGIPWSYIVCNYIPSMYSFFFNIIVLLCIAELCMVTTVPFFLRLFQLKVALLGETGHDSMRLKGIFIPLYMMLYCMIVAFIGVIVVFIGFLFVEPSLSEYKNFYLFMNNWF